MIRRTALPGEGLRGLPRCSPMGIQLGPGQAKLRIYRLSTGERIAMVDLAAAIEHLPDGAAYFANDVTVGQAGIAYVTDTRMNTIFTVYSRSYI